LATLFWSFLTNSFLGIIDSFPFWIWTNCTGRTKENTINLGGAAGALRTEQRRKNKLRDKEHNMPVHPGLWRPVSEAFFATNENDKILQLQFYKPQLPK
jgi:hypothetical protein